MRGVSQHSLQPWRQEGVWMGTLCLVETIDKICPKCCVCARGVCDCLFCIVSLQCVGGMPAWVLWFLCRRSILADLCALHVVPREPMLRGQCHFECVWFSEACPGLPEVE